MVYRRLRERQAEQERATLERDWMTLSEGIELVQRVDAESKVKEPRPPHEQIFDAIEDGELRARWLDEALPSRLGCRSSLSVPPDNPNSSGLRKRKFRLQNGGEMHRGGTLWRKLLLLRKDMQRLFGSAGSGSSSIKELRPLSKNREGMRTIDGAISAIYDLANKQGVKPPNLREIIKPVQKWLAKYKGVTAKGSWIEQLAGEARHNSRRGKSGVMVEGRLLPVSELENLI
jgi:hypothetical protein